LDDPVDGKRDRFRLTSKYFDRALSEHSKTAKKEIVRKRISRG
jgi:hypothetical protein